MFKSTISPEIKNILGDDPIPKNEGHFAPPPQPEKKKESFWRRAWNKIKSVAPTVESILKMAISAINAICNLERTFGKYGNIYQMV